MKKIHIKKDKRANKIINLAAKIFLFPLFFFGLILRCYDKIFKKNKRRENIIDIWY